MTSAAPGRVVIFAAGTEGDVRPFLALGRGLMGAGHDVVLATGPEFAGRVQSEGLAFAPMTINVRAVAERYPGMLDGRFQLAMVRVLLTEMRRMAAAWARDAIEAAREATLIIGSGNVSLVGASVAEKLGVPFVMASLQNFEPSRDLPPVLLQPRWQSGRLNLLLHHATRAFLWQTFRYPIGVVRRDLGLPPYPKAGPWTCRYGFGAPTLYGFSSHVFPRQPEWPERIAVPGFFCLPEAAAYEPAPELARFLADGPPPFYVGFGSMVSGRVTEFGRMIVDAIRLAGVRAVVARGWMGLGDSLGDNSAFCLVDHVPHDWLFSRMAGAVHHCGVGTVAAAVRAGIPTVPVPFAGDQFFNAWQLQRLGVAVPALGRRRLTAALLAEAIRRAGSSAMRGRAAALGESVRAEDGVGGAVRQLQAWGFLAATRNNPTECSPKISGPA